MDDDACAARDERAHRETGTTLPLRAISACGRIHVAFALSLALAWLILPSTQAKAACLKGVAEAVSVQGKVEVRHDGRLGWQPLMRGQAICAGDVARAESNSRADILLGGHTHMRLDQQTTVRFPRPTPKKRTWLDVVQGWLHFISRTPQRLEVDTPYVNAAIEGTEFAVRIEDDRTLLWVYEGRVVASNAQGALTLTNGEAAVAEQGQAPRPQIDLNPRDAVDWALYYPPLLDLRTLDAGPGRAALTKAIALYQAGDVPAALQTLDNVPDAERDTRYFNIKTALLLSVGRVKKAQAAIAAARQRDPQSAAPLAYESIIALTQNRKDEARDLAEQAVILDPDSPITHAARAYALQASFDLEGALEDARRTVELAPNDALAWARLAELELSRGYSDAAVNAAEKAKALDPAVARTQSVLGFVNLARIDTDQATQAFNAAIARDQADPLPRLGLGLAKIREGDLEGGRRDIEIAASLDPSQSLVRSYLGKAYFDEKRDPLAAEQYAMAEELDPKDPTPWFYDAILKQTENRPVEALHDIQRSIKLNNNRAVYRSRLLLDQDLAARSASQGRIYRDLGFEQLALVEGWKSVNTDPSSYSAHRLLADSYSALPHHEIARVSELLQSQLLQPLNLTPIQPQLAQSDLLLLEGLGPSGLSFNEFNPLFTRNGLALQASGVVGGNDTVGDEIVQSGLWDNFSYSLGQFHYATDGFRENNDLQQDIYNIFLQGRVLENLSVQTEYRHAETEHGDLEFNFDLDEFSPDRRAARTDSMRLGLNYSLGSHSNIILSSIYLDEEVRTGESGESLFDSQGYLSEAQYLLQGSHLDIVSGLGHYDADLSISTLSPPEFDTQHSNGYLYSYIRYPQRVSWTIGASYDSLEDGLLGNFDQFSPKLGAIWNITPNTTLRLAALKTLNRPLLTDQTIEPTQVAGFNQLFDDVGGTESTRYGIALDQKMSSVLFGGLELSRRELDVPVPVVIGKSDIEEWQEESYRAYLNWALNPRLSASLEYEREQFEGGEISGGPNTDTQFVPIALAFNHPSGFFAQAKTTYVDQEVELTNGDEFFLTDVGVGYRLPKRYGMLTIEVNNVLDAGFSFQGLHDRTPHLEARPPFLPERAISVGVTLAF